MLLCSGRCRSSSCVPGPASPGSALALATHLPLHRATYARTFKVLDILRGHGYEGRDSSWRDRIKHFQKDAKDNLSTCMQFLCRQF